MQKRNAILVKDTSVFRIFGGKRNFPGYIYSVVGQFIFPKKKGFIVLIVSIGKYDFLSPNLSKPQREKVTQLPPPTNMTLSGIELFDLRLRQDIQGDNSKNSAKGKVE